VVKEFKIIDEAGLHARPASLLVKTASSFPNDIKIEFEGKLLDMKSIMAVMSLGVPQNGLIKIHVDGENAEEIIQELENILQMNFLI
jgi:phosphocarrier protein